MTLWLSSVWDWCRRWWTLPHLTFQPLESGLPMLDAPPAPVVEGRPERRRPGSPDQDPIVWSFRGTILDRLTEYFASIGRIRRYDSVAYEYFSRVGFAIAPEGGILSLREDLFPSERPACGGLLLASLPHPEGSLVPSFVYFMKVKTPTGVECCGGDLYRFVSVFDERDADRGYRSRYYAPVQCHVVIGRDGTPVLLREAYQDGTAFQVGRGRTRQKIRVPVIRWRVPQWVAEFDAEQELNAKHWTVLQLFRMVFLTHQRTTSKILVRAKRHGLTAAFGIELPTAKRFFRDRARVLARDGKQKRIFHAVRAHDRQLADGREVEVRRHYRGLRHFDWQGSAIHIVWPTTDLNTFTAAQVELAQIPRAERKDYLTVSEAATSIASVLEK